MQSATDLSIKELNEWLEDFGAVDVAAIDGVCNDFHGFIEDVDGVKFDTDNSPYLTVLDQEDDAFDIPLTHIRLVDS